MSTSSESSDERCQGKKETSSVFVVMLNNVSFLIVSHIKSCLLWSQVTDFGLSVKKGGVGSENMLEATCGTPMYMGNSHTQKHTFTFLFFNNEKSGFNL